MNQRLSDWIATATAYKVKIAFITAGGGAGLFDLFKIPGASRVLTEARMLYSRDSFTAFFRKPFNGRYVTQETADLLALHLDQTSEANVCFAVTCALSTDRKRRGENRGYLSVSQQGNLTLQGPIQIIGDTRADQDSYLTNAVLDHIQTLVTES